MEIWDGLILAGIALLVFFTAFAYGAVDTWALGVAEIVCFSLLLLWLIKSCFFAADHGSSIFAQADFLLLAVPSALIVALMLFQLLPLPPAVLRQLSPRAYEIYRKSLPGWPGQVVYDAPGYATRFARTKTPAAALLPTIEELENGAPIPFSPKPAAAPGTGADDQGSAAMEGAAISGSSPPSSWRPLSVAPVLTRAGILKCCAYGSLFFLVIFYPTGNGEPEKERTFRRVLVLVVLAVGTAVAFVGLTQEAFWHETILPLYGSSGDAIRRASGPFANPDHFANYLAMILPLALVGAIFRVPFEPARDFSGFQLLCAAMALVLTAAILVSLSRAGWIEIGLAILTLAWLLGRRHRNRLDDEAIGRLPSSSVTWWLMLSGLGLFTVLGLAVLLVGPSGREQASARMAGSVSAGGVEFWDRVDMWADSARMIRDYPLFGTGLDSWAAIFPHYQRPPWSMNFAAEAQNDYVEAAVEYGIAGLLLLSWMAWKVGQSLLQGSRALASRQWPLFAALIPAIVVMGFHELLDFCLQIPANAVLFVLLIGLAMRMTRSYRMRPEGFRERAAAGVLVPAVLAIGSLTAIVAIAGQRETLYPDDLHYPPSLRANTASIVSYPSSPFPHLWLADRSFKASGKWPLEDLEAAVWLDPNNPGARDRYVQALMSEGRQQQALSQISASLYLAPRLEDHLYLQPRLLPWLSRSERAAVETGLRKAVADGFEKSMEGLAQLYLAEGRELDAARMYEEAGQNDPVASRQFGYYLAAGECYAKAGMRDRAERLFTAAANLAPDDSRPYRDLIAWVYVPEKNFASVNQAIQNAMNNGLSPAPLYASFAEAAQAAGDSKLLEAALREAVKSEPSFYNLIRLGEFYLGHEQYERAGEPIRQAVEVNPESGQAYFDLALSEEGAYQYSQAQADYERAVALAPDNPEFKHRRQDLMRRIAQDSVTRH